MRKIRKRCACGCGEITNPGRMYIRGHQRRGKRQTAEAKEEISEAKRGKKHTAETIKKISKSHQGKKHTAETKEKMSKAHQGKKHSEESKLKMSLAKIKFDPNDPYCDVWKDKKYRKDIRKDYCENVDCKKITKKLCSHHIYLDKKKCAPNDIITLCNSCHAILHRQLQRGKYKPADPKDFVIINRPDHISYIHKKSREIIKIKKAKTFRRK